MSVNRGKSFESVIKSAFEKVNDVSIDRLHDQTTGYIGSSNICDFIVYKKPYEYYIECKTVHGNTFSIFSNDKSGKGEVYGNVTKKQWEGLSEKAKISGVLAGVLIWWVDKDTTKFISIEELQNHRENNKSVRYDAELGIELSGKKKRVFFDYDMQEFFNSTRQNYAL